MMQSASLRVRAAGVAAVLVSAALALGAAWRGATGAAGASAARLAAGTAAYLQLVTPPGPDGKDYALGRLLVRARALATVPGWSPAVEVYHGRAPLVDAGGAPLAADALARLRGGAALVWDGARAVAPLKDAIDSAVVGAVAVPRGTIRLAPLPAVLTATFLLLFGAFGVFASLRVGRRGALARYAVCAVAFGVAAGADAWLVARAGTDRDLTDTRLLLEEGAVRAAAPGADSAADLRERLLPLAAGEDLLPGDSGDFRPRRVVRQGVERAVVPVRLGAGRWAVLEAVPAEARAAGWIAVCALLALLGPAALFGLGLGHGAAEPHRPG